MKTVKWENGNNEKIIIENSIIKIRKEVRDNPNFTFTQYMRIGIDIDGNWIAGVYCDRKVIVLCDYLDDTLLWSDFAHVIAAAIPILDNMVEHYMTEEFSKLVEWLKDNVLIVS